MAGQVIADPQSASTAIDIPFKSGAGVGLQVRAPAALAVDLILQNIRRYLNGIY